MLPKLKVYEVDYSFIIKNYLNPELWKKIWNLFIFKDYVFYLVLSNIDTEKMEIWFKVKCNKNENAYEYIRYSINNMTVDFLKNLINKAIYRLIDKTEVLFIQSTEGYKYINDGKDRQEKLLTEIAENFLDNNNVTNKDIRDVYVDYYVSENLDISEKLSDYVRECKYKYLSDLWLIFANSINDKNQAEFITRQLNDDEREEIIKEVEEYLKYLDTYEAVSDFENKLEII